MSKSELIQSEKDKEHQIILNEGDVNKKFKKSNKKKKKSFKEDKILKNSKSIRTEIDQENSSNENCENNLNEPSDSNIVNEQLDDQAAEIDQNLIENIQNEQKKENKTYQFRKKFRRKFFCRRLTFKKSKTSSFEDNDLNSSKVYSSEAENYFNNTNFVKSNPRTYSKKELNYSKNLIDEELNIKKSKVNKSNSNKSKNQKLIDKDNQDFNSNDEIGFLRNGKVYSTRGVNTSKPYNVLEMFECYESQSESDIKESNDENEIDKEFSETEDYRKIAQKFLQTMKVDQETKLSKGTKVNSTVLFLINLIRISLLIIFCYGFYQFYFR